MYYHLLKQTPSVALATRAMNLLLVLLVATGALAGKFVFAHFFKRAFCLRMQVFCAIFARDILFKGNFLKSLFILL